MARVIITALVIAAIATGIFYYNSQKQLALQQAQEQRIADLQSQVSALKSENEQLKAALAKVQAEQSNLAAQNEALNKAIAQYKATGRMPALNLPYPPK